MKVYTTRRRHWIVWRLDYQFVVTLPLGSEHETCEGDTRVDPAAVLADSLKFYSDDNSCSLLPRSRMRHLEHVKWKGDD